MMLYLLLLSLVTVHYMIMGSLSDSYQANFNITYLCVFILSITTGSERSSLVGILEDGVIFTGNVLYNVGSALGDAGYRGHVANML
jgi:hypothetical protein